MSVLVLANAALTGSSGGAGGAKSSVVSSPVFAGFCRAIGNVEGRVIILKTCVVLQVNLRA